MVTFIHNYIWLLQRHRLFAISQTLFNKVVSLLKFQPTICWECKWLKQVQRTRAQWKEPTVYSWVCNEHFTEDCFQPASLILGKRVKVFKYTYMFNKCIYIMIIIINNDMLFSIVTTFLFETVRNLHTTLTN